MVCLDNLFQRIKERKTNAKKISEDTGISTGNISDWKSGRSMPSASKLDVLADYLDCSVDYLLGRTDAPTAPMANSEFDTLYNQLDNEDKAEVRGMIKGLLRADKYQKSKPNTNIADEL